LLVFDFAIHFFIRESLRVESDGFLPLCGDLLKLLVFLCRSCDARQQEHVVLLFLAICERVVALCGAAMRALASGLTHIIYTGELFVGAKPILRILTPIVGGFAVPLRRRHARLFSNVIVPLHRNAFVGYFHDELSALVVAFPQKDRDLVGRLFRFLVAVWPRMNPEKQILFLMEIGWLSSFVRRRDVNAIVYAVAPSSWPRSAAATRRSRRR